MATFYNKRLEDSFKLIKRGLFTRIVDNTLTIIDKDFEMMEVPVTQYMWMKIMGTNSSKFSCLSEPAVKVSWNDCQDFIKKLNILNKDYHYDLPTEDQWEYAAQYVPKNLNDYCWFDENSNGKLQPVATKLPNNNALYDMYGNIWEWNKDNYEGGSYRVIRGGCWFNYAQYLCSAVRFYDSVGVRNYDVGFRLVRTRKE